MILEDRDSPPTIRSASLGSWRKCWLNILRHRGINIADLQFRVVYTLPSSRQLTDDGGRMKTTVGGSVFLRTSNVGATYSKTVLLNEYRVVAHQLCHSLRVLEAVQRVQLVENDRKSQ